MARELGRSQLTTRSFTLPNTSSELAILARTQTFSGNKTFSGTLTASGAVTLSAVGATIGTATTTATYGMGAGATPNSFSKTLNFGTGLMLERKTFLKRLEATQEYIFGDDLMPTIIFTVARFKFGHHSAKVSPLSVMSENFILASCRLLVQRIQHGLPSSRTSPRIDLSMNRAVRRGSM